MKKILIDLTISELTLLIWSLEDVGLSYSDEADQLQMRLREARSALEKQPNLVKP